MKLNKKICKELYFVSFTAIKTKSIGCKEPKSIGDGGPNKRNTLYREFYLLLSQFGVELDLWKKFFYFKSFILSLIFYNQNFFMFCFKFFSGDVRQCLV